MESKGQGTGTTFHFTIQLLRISPDILSFQALQNVVAQSTEIEDPETVLSFLISGLRPQTKLNSSSLTNYDIDKLSKRKLCILILLSSSTNERVITNHLTRLRDYSVEQIIVHSKEEVREALAIHQEVDCIISDLLLVGKVENYLRENEGENRLRIPYVILLAPQMEWESEEAMKWKQTYCSVHFLRTPLKQLSLATELRTIFNSYFTCVERGSKEEEMSEEKEMKGRRVEPHEEQQRNERGVQRNRQNSGSAEEETKKLVNSAEERSAPLVLIVEDNYLNQKARICLCWSSFLVCVNKLNQKSTNTHYYYRCWYECCRRQDTATQPLTMAWRLSTHSVVLHLTPSSWYLLFSQSAV